MSCLRSGKANDGEHLSREGGARISKHVGSSFLSYSLFLFVLLHLDRYRELVSPRSMNWHKVTKFICNVQKVIRI